MGTATIDFDSTELADWFAGPEGPACLAGNNVDTRVTGTVVTFDDDGLTHLASLNEEDDGHYDGTHIWIGGAAYAVINKGGRPAIGPRTTIRLSEADYAALDKRATENGVDRSSLIRRYIGEGLARQNDERDRGRAILGLAQVAYDMCGDTGHGPLVRYLAGWMGDRHPSDVLEDVVLSLGGGDNSSAILDAWIAWKRHDGVPDLGAAVVEAIGDGTRHRLYQDMEDVIVTACCRSDAAELGVPVG